MHRMAHIQDRTLSVADPLHGLIKPEDTVSAELREALALWNAARGTRRFPARQQMTPRALGRLLRHIVLIKVFEEGREFQIRIMGDSILAVQTDPLVGLTTAEIDTRLPGYGLALHRIYSHVVHHMEPIALRGRILREADSKIFHREHLLVPLGESDAVVDHLLSFVIYLNPVV